MYVLRLQVQLLFQRMIPHKMLLSEVKDSLGVVVKLNWQKGEGVEDLKMTIIHPLL